MIYRKGDTEGSPEGKPENREGLNSPLDPGTSQKEDQPLPMTGGAGEREDQPLPMTGGIGQREVQAASMTGGAGEREDQPLSMTGGAGEREEQPLSMSGGAGEREEQAASISGEMEESEKQSLTEASMVSEGKNVSGEGKSKKGEGNLILRLLNSEGMRYLFIGGCTTMVNLVVYAVLCRVVHLNVNISNIISVSVSILFAYITNKLIVFRSHCSSLSELAAECARFIGARLATMVIEVGGVFVLYEILHQNEMVAKLATQVLVVIGNYFISRFLVFKDRDK